MTNYDDFYRNRWQTPTSATDVDFQIETGIDLISLVALSMPGTSTECWYLRLMSVPLSVPRNRNLQVPMGPVRRTDHPGTGTSTEAPLPQTAIHL